MVQEFTVPVSGEGFYSTAQALDVRTTMHSDSAAALASTYSSLTSGGMYPRVNPYETAWPYNFATAQPQAQTNAAALKSSQDTVSGSAAVQTAAWWNSMHSAATTNWLQSAAETAASLQLPVHTKAVSPTDYAAGFTSFSSTPASYLSSGHNLLPDTYKSMLPSAASQNSLPTTVGSAFLPRAPGLSSVGLPTRSPRRGYTGRSTCDCPNCQEAEKTRSCTTEHEDATYIRAIYLVVVSMKYICNRV